MGTPSPKVAVTPPALCRVPALRAELSRLFPEVLFNDSPDYFDEDGLIRFAGGAAALLVGRDPVTERVLQNLPDLKIVAKYGVGLDNVDQAALKKQGVVLGWEGGVNRRSVAELTLGFMLTLCHNVWVTGSRLSRGEWHKNGGVELRGKTIGIVGCGHVGKEVARLLAPFQCRVLVRDLLPMSDFCRETGVVEVDWDTVLAESDILSLHVPLDASTRGMLNGGSLGRMKPGSFLINTSRGGVVDEDALKAALRSGHLQGAALDVFTQEPPVDLDLLSHPNLIATPHIGGNAKEAVEAMARAAIAHLARFFDLMPDGRRAPEDGFQRDHWQAYYNHDDLRWDIGAVSPPLKRLWEEGALNPGRVIIPGCGQGHEVLYCVRQGCEVTGVDYTEGAVGLLRGNLERAGLAARVIQSDFFELDSTHDASYDLMLEQTFFCAIHPRDRERYVETARRILRPGGLLAGVFYETGEAGGPPYNTTQDHIREHFSGSFEIVRLEKCDHSHERRAGREVLAILKKL